MQVEDEDEDEVYGRRMAPWVADVMCLGHVSDDGVPVLMLFADADPGIDEAMAAAGLLTVRGRLSRTVWTQARAMFCQAACGLPPTGFRVEFSMFPDGATGGIRMNVASKTGAGSVLARQLQEGFPGLVAIDYAEDGGQHPAREVAADKPPAAP